jgi:hypothetical protein
MALESATVVVMKKFSGAKKPHLEVWLNDNYHAEREE